MEKYINAFVDSLLGSVEWTWKSILFEVPWYTNYFWGLTAISLLVWLLEIAFPWRKNQSIFRRDFWLDAFYMYFNFFLFAIAISGFYKFFGLLFNDIGISASRKATAALCGGHPHLDHLGKQHDDFESLGYADVGTAAHFLYYSGFCSMVYAYFIAQIFHFVEFSQGTPFSQRDGICRASSLPLDGKHPV